mmetsp:Transcript_15379/g.51641  ORF Transcript_15379/g.51641 Transcript_15379/m.51641 type:complete len:205 (+) Transcript_15379:2145-2759(+)
MTSRRGIRSLPSSKSARASSTRPQARKPPPSWGSSGLAKSSSPTSCSSSNKARNCSGRRSRLVLSSSTRLGSCRSSSSTPPTPTRPPGSPSPIASSDRWMSCSRSWRRKRRGPGSLKIVSKDSTRLEAWTCSGCSTLRACWQSTGRRYRGCSLRQRLSPSCLRGQTRLSRKRKWERRFRSWRGCWTSLTRTSGRSRLSGCWWTS